MEKKVVQNSVESIYYLHDVIGCPEDAIAMKILGGIEPHLVALFPSSAGASISIHVGLDTPWLSIYVS